MLVDWCDLSTCRADEWDGAQVAITGWIAPLEREDRYAYFLLTPEPVCCRGCLPSDPLACVEVFARRPIPAQRRAVRLAGQWRLLRDDPTGWRYQLRDARLEGEAAGAGAITRRGFLSATVMYCLGVLANRPAAAASGDDPAARQVIADHVTIDTHSHAGNILRVSSGSHAAAPLNPVAAPMRDGGMAVICLAMVTDSAVTRVTPDHRIMASRDPAPGELYAWSQRAFARVMELVRIDKLAVVTEPSSLRAAQGHGPAIVISAEGADFLEGRIERVDEAYRAYQLRHLQLTHYRVNELGDIQTAPPVHGGLTEFGADVVRACNRLGVVVDVAHGTYDLVTRAAAVTTKPLVLSHTSLTDAPRYGTRLITADHARAIADTGGLIGVWPPTSEFPNMKAFVDGIRRMVDVVGVDHVGLGSDMLGLLVPSVFDSYRKLPQLVAALLAAGFQPDEAGKIVGGNYARVFEATAVG